MFPLCHLTEGASAPDVTEQTAQSRIAARDKGRVVSTDPVYFDLPYEIIIPPLKFLAST